MAPSASQSGQLHAPIPVPIPRRRILAVLLYALLAALSVLFIALDGAPVAAVVIAIALAVPAVLGWTKPIAGASIMLALAGLLAIFWFYMVVVQMDRPPDVSLGYLVVPYLATVLPLLVCGLLLLSERRSPRA